jgi:hypothetical protein
MNRYRIAQLVALCALVTGAPAAYGQRTCVGSPDVNQVCVDPGSGLTPFANALGVSDPQQLTNDILNQVNNIFQVADVGAFLKDFQNTQAFSSKGLGVDYASETTLAEVGATISFATSVDKSYNKPSGSYSDPMPLSSGGLNFSLMGGLGLGLIGLDPVMIFGNWFKGNASFGQLDGSYDNWGVHGQVRLLGPSRKMSAAKFLIRWGGIAITSGADYSRMTLNARKDLQSTFALPAYSGVSQGTVSIQNQGTLTFSLQQTTWTVPLEFTTSLRLLSLLTIYGGFGLDFQLGGGSDLDINMTSGNLTGKVSSAAGTTPVGDLGTATITVKQHANPSAARFREIIGLQVGVFDIVRVFVQVNNTPSSPSLTSIAAGLRLGI